MLNCNATGRTASLVVRNSSLKPLVPVPAFVSSPAWTAFRLRIPVEVGH